MSDRRRHLLWVDGFAGATVGVVMLTTYSWLSRWYHLPQGLLVGMGIANLAYASFSLSLARRATRPAVMIRLLVVANLVWGLACFRWAVLHAETATWLGTAHLVGEGLIVGGLGLLEWRWRALLRTA